MTGIYLRKGGSGLDACVNAEIDAEKGIAVFSPRGGGFQMRAPLDSFLSHYESVDPERLASWRTSPQPLRVGLEGLDEAVDAYTLGERWNGFEVPLFDREGLKRIEEFGVLSKPEFGALLFLDEESGHLAFVSHPTGGSLGDDVEGLRAAVSHSLLAGKEAGELAFGGSILEFSSSPGVDHLVEGRQVRLWDAGFGLCWDTFEEHAPAPSP